MDTVVNDMKYTNLSMELTGKIFNKSYTGFKLHKDDMIQNALLELWKSKDRFDKTKGSIQSFMCAIIYNAYNLFIRDNIYKHKDKLISIDVNMSDDEEENTTLLDTIGKIDSKYQDIEYIELLKEFDNVVEKRNKNKYNKINKDELYTIIGLLVEGYKQNEVAKLLEVSTTTMHRKVNIIKSIIEEIKNN